MKITKKQEEGVLQEDMSSDIKLILEYTSRIPKIEDRVDKIEERLEKIEINIAVIKTGHEKIEALDKRVKKLESGSFASVR